jgi:hypothetical protein
MNWISAVLAGGGAGAITAAFMEAYYQRRAQDQMGMFDKIPEDSDHRAG